jgi:hypothetical protein
MHYRAIARFAQIVYFINMTIIEFVAALNLKFNNIFELGKPSAKYTRVINTSCGSRSVYCFIDADGNIYKAASWKAPAKGVRSTLASVDIARVDQYGGWLYR